MLGAHSFQKTLDVDTPEDEHPLETLFALFVTLRYDEGNPSGPSVSCLQGGFPRMGPTLARTHTHTQDTALSLQAGLLGPRGGGFSHVFCPHQQFSGLREGRPGPHEQLEVTTQTGTYLSPATWLLGWRAASSDLGRLADREGAMAGASKVTGDRGTCGPRTLTSA